MSDQTPPPPVPPQAPPPPQSPPPPPPGQPGQPYGYAPPPGYVPQPPTESLAIAGLITGIVFWPVGIFLNPIALGRIRRNGLGGRPLAIVGLIFSILGAVGTVIAIIAIVISAIFAAATVGAAGKAIKDYSDSLPSSSPFDDSTSPSSQSDFDAKGTIGTQVVSSEGVGYTVSNVTCGIASVGSGDFTATPDNGQYCRIDVQIANTGTETYDYSPFSATAYQGESSWDGDLTADIYDDDDSNVNPEVATGQTINEHIYFDVPQGTSFDRVTFDHFVDDGVEITLK